MNRKVYVDVEAEFTADGLLRPKSLRWEDGREYKIERVKDVRPVAKFKLGGTGMRYTILVRNQEKYLFYEDRCRWFVERVGGREST